MSLNSIHLSEKQAVIVHHKGGAMLVQAGPGSGKTRVLTERIRVLLSEAIDHSRVLGLTFTNKAAIEMEERLSDLGNLADRLFLGTLHSFCMNVLNDRGTRVGITGPIVIFEKYEDRVSILREAAYQEPSLYNRLKNRDPKDQTKILKEWLGTIGTYKSNPSKIGRWDSPFDENLLEAYNGGLRASCAYDFDDILLLCYRLLTEHPKIAGYYRRLYRHICVDEAQDLNEAQYNVIHALCGDEFENVLFVGDSKQSIYGFADAGPKFMDQFVRDFAAQRIELNENFRSAASIVDLAQKLAPDYLNEARLPIRGEVNVLKANDPEDEARAIVDKIKQLLQQGHKDVEGAISCERCAILARNRYGLLELERILDQDQIPYYKRISSLHENESELVEDFVLALRIFVNESDSLHRKQLELRWQQGTVCDKKYLGYLTSMAVKPEHLVVVNAIHKLDTKHPNSLKEAIEVLSSFAHTVDDLALKSSILQDTKVLLAELDHYKRKSAGGSTTLSGFLASMALGTTHQCQRDGVALLTVHSSKGLEFDAVFVVGLSEGVFPDYRAVTTEEVDEERRNLFVAVTRSRRLLYLSYPLEREMPWGDMRDQEPSRFLVESELA